MNAILHHFLMPRSVRNDEPSLVTAVNLLARTGQNVMSFEQNLPRGAKVGVPFAHEESALLEIMAAVHPLEPKHLRMPSALSGAQHAADLIGRLGLRFLPPQMW